MESFEELGLSENVLRGVYAFGFEEPSSIQKRAIPLIIENKDVVAQSQSGTGKTGAFVVSVLERVSQSTTTEQGLTKAIIVAPVRELAYQIRDVANGIGQYTGINIVLSVGGSNMQECRRELQEGVNIVVGTPGRIIDMIERRYIELDGVDMLVMDEADEMLSNNFQRQIRTLVERMPSRTQICLFSATMSPEMLELTKKFMRDPVYILIKQDCLTLDGIKQYYVDVGHERNKYETFCDLYSTVSINQSMVYVNTIDKASRLKRQLNADNFTVCVIHSKMEPSERADIMKSFRNGSARVLISTDLLSRGIDVQQVSVVINYDLPNNKDCYIHRIGRSGRYGRKGVAINMVSSRDHWKINELEQFYCTQIEPLPEKAEICAGI